MLKPSSVAWMRFLEFILTRAQATHPSVLLLYFHLLAALYLTLNLNLLTLNQNQLFSEYSWNIPASDVTVCRQGWSGIAAELAELALVNQVDDVTTDQLMTTPYIQTKVQIRLFLNLNCWKHTEYSLLFYAMFFDDQSSILKRSQMKKKMQT